METLRTREVEKHEKHLGLTTIIGRSKKMVFTYRKMIMEENAMLEGEAPISPW